MDASRDNLQARGFYIRKLNQAYFAFYGSYAEDPSAGGRTAAEISDGIKGMRQRSASLGAFLWRISGVSSYQEFVTLTAAR